MPLSTREVNYGFIEWKCSCGQLTKTAKVGINHLIEIVAFWKCRACKHNAYSKIPLADFLRRVPASYALGTKDHELERKLTLIIEAMHSLTSNMRKAIEPTRRKNS